MNIAAVCPSTRVLGPGRRFAVWVQGCCFDCPNCGSPEWRETKTEMLMKPERLAEEVLRVDGIEGVTVSGGEPMLQAKSLAKFVRLVRAKRASTVVCYTSCYI